MLRYKLSVKVKRSLAGCEPGTATFTRGEGGGKRWYRWRRRRCWIYCGRLKEKRKKKGRSQRLSWRPWPNARRPSRLSVSEPLIVDNLEGHFWSRPPSAQCCKLRTNEWQGGGVSTLVIGWDELNGSGGGGGGGGSGGRGWAGRWSLQGLCVCFFSPQTTKFWKVLKIPPPGAPPPHASGIVLTSGESGNMEIWRRLGRLICLDVTHVKVPSMNLRQ